MSDSISLLKHKMDSASDLHSIVRTMKAIAASSITQYDTALAALNAYDHTVRLGLTACLKQTNAQQLNSDYKNQKDFSTVALVFGSDQGLVGQFNDVLSDYVVAELAKLPGQKMVWNVGERLCSRLLETGLSVTASFTLPKTMGMITKLVGDLILELENNRVTGRIGQVFIFHNKPKARAGYEPVRQQLLPLDKPWRDRLMADRWPSNNIPEVVHYGEKTLLALVQEYLFVSLFRACAESLASENASRLATMQRAEKNIAELLSDMHGRYHRLRQSGIDEELFDIISGFKALEIG